jgi:transposase
MTTSENLEKRLRRRSESRYTSPWYAYNSYLLQGVKLDTDAAEKI